MARAGAEDSHQLVACAVAVGIGGQPRQGCTVGALSEPVLSGRGRAMQKIPEFFCTAGGPVLDRGYHSAWPEYHQSLSGPVPAGQKNSGIFCIALPLPERTGSERAPTVQPWRGWPPIPTATAQATSW